MRDLCIIGCGIVGSTLAYELSAYSLDTVVLEKELDIALGASRANYAVIHAGYDSEPGSLMAKYTVSSAEQMPEISRRLGFRYDECGSLLISRNEEEDQILRERCERGRKNGVRGLELWDAERCRREESKLSPDVRMALYAPHSGIVNPWDYVSAFSRVALREGVDFYLDHEVLDIEVCPGGYRIFTNRGVIESRMVINAAGVDSGHIHSMISEEVIALSAQKTSFYFLEKAAGDLPSHIVLSCPRNKCRGILAAPTLHGNFIIGESCEILRDKQRKCTDFGFNELRKEVESYIPGLDPDANYRRFAGERLCSEGQRDFVLSFAREGFFDCLAICSPGLSAAPMMAKEICARIVESFSAGKKSDWDGSCGEGVPRPADNGVDGAEESEEEFIERILRRSESVTAEEITRAISRGLQVSSLDWVKARDGIRKGRCVGCLCSGEEGDLL